MLVAYLESIKYVGHLWPVALLRILLGYNFIGQVVERVQMGYLEHAHISERVRLSAEGIAVPTFYFDFFKHVVQTHSEFMTYLLLGMELVIGLSYIIGYGVRITAILGIILAMHIYLFFDFAISPGQTYLIYLHLMFLLLGAGRCLGVDYYFYKSRRGLLW